MEHYPTLFADLKSFQSFKVKQIVTERVKNLTESNIKLLIKVTKLSFITYPNTKLIIPALFILFNYTALFIRDPRVITYD